MNELGIPAGPDRKRLAVILVVTAAVLTCIAIFLPFRFIRLMIMGILAIPFGVYLVERPHWLFYAFAFILFSNIDIFLPGRPFAFIVIMLSAALILAIVNGRKFVAPDRTFAILLSVFVLLAFQSIAFAVDTESAWGGMRVLVRTLVNVLLIMQFVRTRKEFVVFLIVVTAATVVTNFLPLVIPPPAHHADKTLMWEMGVLRYEGYLREANFFAFHQIFFIPILLILFARFARPRFVRPLLLVLLAGTIFVLSLSFSRGGFVSLLVILVLLLVVERRNHAVLYTGLSVLVAAGIAAPAIYWDRIKSLLEVGEYLATDYAILIRVETIKVAIELGLQNIIFGVGIHNFLYNAARFIPFVQVVHNAFLQVFAELGLPALVVMLAMIVYNFRIMARMAGSGDREEAQVGRILIIHQIAVVVHSMSIPTAYGHLLWLTLALPSIARTVYSSDRGMEKSLRL
jgi:O-antigen ligase